MPDPLPPLIRELTDKGLFPECIQRGLVKRGITTPTPIQAQVIPLLLRGMNLIGISKTGSGKSVAFLLPAILKCIQLKASKLERNAKKEPLVLVLSPVRELATQLQEELSDYATELQMLCLYGGKDKKNQEMAFFRGIDIVVGTPGRINEFLENEELSLRHVKYLVLDEADQLLNMGFIEQIKNILSTVQKTSQIGLFSATWPSSMREIADTYLSQAITVNVKNVEIEIHEKFIYLENNEHRNSALRELLRTKKDRDLMIIFVNTKQTCKELGEMFSEYKITIIQGDLTQTEREKAMEEFRSGLKPVLIATDIAARGIHIEGVEFVVNFEPPDSLHSYTHRIGRTGRAGKSGTAISILKDGDIDLVRALFNKLKTEELRGILDKMEEKGGRGGGGGRGRKGPRRDEHRRDKYEQRGPRRDDRRGDRDDRDSKREDKKEDTKEDRREERKEDRREERKDDRREERKDDRREDRREDRRKNEDHEKR